MNEEATIPVASVTVSATKSPDPRLTNWATAAAESAAVAAMGPAIRCLELPKAAKRTRAAGAA
jgi:hypothetical protein